MESFRILFQKNLRGDFTIDDKDSLKYILQVKVKSIQSALVKKKTKNNNNIKLVYLKDLTRLQKSPPPPD